MIRVLDVYGAPDFGLRVLILLLLWLLRTCARHASMHTTGCPNKFRTAKKSDKSQAARYKKFDAFLLKILW